MELSDIINMNVREFGQAFLPGTVMGFVFRVNSIVSKEKMSQKAKFGSAIFANGLIDVLDTYRYFPPKYDLTYSILNDFGGVAGFFCGMEMVDVFYHGFVLMKRYFKK